MVLMDKVDKDKVDIALAFRRVYSNDNEAHQYALALRGCDVCSQARHTAPDCVTPGVECRARHVHTHAGVFR